MTPQDRSRRGAGGGSDAERLSKRLHDLSARITAESDEQAPPRAPAAGDQSGSRYGMAFRLASEFVAAVLVGAGLGWLLDRLAGTSPFGLIILLLLGFGAGILNMARASQRLADSQAASPPPAGPPLDEDDDED